MPKLYCLSDSRVLQQFIYRELRWQVRLNSGIVGIFASHGYGADLQSLGINVNMQRAPLVETFRLMLVLHLHPPSLKNFNPVGFILDARVWRLHKVLKSGASQVSTDICTTDYTSSVTCRNIKPNRLLIVKQNGMSAFEIRGATPAFAAPRHALSQSYRQSPRAVSEALYCV